MSGGLPAGLARLAEASAAPREVGLTLLRLLEARPEAAGRLLTGAAPTVLARRVAAVAAASNSLGRLIVADSGALDVLDDLDGPVILDPRRFDPGRVDPGRVEGGRDRGGVEAAVAGNGELVREQRRALLRIAARDLTGRDDLVAVTAALADLAASVLQVAVTVAELGSGDEPVVPGEQVAVIAMGKLGGRELNYASDIDVVFVTAPGVGDDLPRRLLEVGRSCYRVDAALRPEGRAGPLARTVDAYEHYWARWAKAWELQALVKARPAAGSEELGRRFAQAAERRLWHWAVSGEEIAEIRAMKARTESLVARRGLGGREIKRGPGGIRDVEFSVQLLQLVHGRLDPSIRSPSTLTALDALAAAGYVDRDDARALAHHYRFLRSVEHRLQLVEEEQVHVVPPPGEAFRRLARVLGFADDTGGGADEHFADSLRRARNAVRAIHDRLFFRPLLEAFAELPHAGARAGESGNEPAAPAPEAPMAPEAVEVRLAAFGFADAERTRHAVAELAGGLSRSSRLMSQMLPLVLDWLSLSPDPDLGLLGLRDLTAAPHARGVLVPTFRESPEAARRLCLVLGSSRILGETLRRNPELMARMGDDSASAAARRGDVVDEAAQRLRARSSPAGRRTALLRLRQDEVLGVATRDLLGLDLVEVVGAALTTLNEALVEAAVAFLEPHRPFTVVGLGRFGGAQLSYASDLDLVFVTADDPTPGGDATRVAEGVLRMLQGPVPVERVAHVDLALRPDGGAGALVRDLDGYRQYFARWGQTWERQAMLRARVVAGDAELGHAFLPLVRSFVFEEPFGHDEVAEVRRMKARIEHERIPAREDAQFHLKLGPGALADVEWTVQLLQLQHRVPGTDTLRTLSDLEDRGLVAAPDAAALGRAYRFCESTRNRWYLVGALPGGGSPGDALPPPGPGLTRLARSLATTPPELRAEYRRVTRRARRVTERLFYGLSPPTT